MPRRGRTTQNVAIATSVAELLAFWVGEEEYGVDIVQIQEIIKLPPLTVVPRAPTCVLGIISLRGTVVPVADLRAILGMKRVDANRDSRILVLRGDPSSEEPGGVA